MSRKFRPQQCPECKHYEGRQLPIRSVCHEYDRNRGELFLHETTRRCPFFKNKVEVK